MKIILASQSPRRRELLKILFDDFEIIPDSSPENADERLDTQEYVSVLAENKCLNVAEKVEGECLVIAADTVVVKDGNILGKPRDRDEAKRMLTALNGSVHSVYTGVCVYDSRAEKTVTFFEKTDVHFYNISEADIDRYIDTGEPMDKAGAYGIQEKGTLFVKRIEGDYNNVVGLPIARLKLILNEKFGFQQF